MAKIKITKDLIKSFAEQDRSKYIRNVNKTVNSVLTQSIDALSKKISYINIKNVILQPINEILSGGFIDNSTCTYFLGIKSAQLEINTNKQINFFRNLKERFKFAWANRKLLKKRRRRKRRRKKDEVNLEKIVFDPSKYNIYNLAEDLQNSLVNVLTETSLIEMHDNFIKLRGKDDFGPSTNVIIYLTTISEDKFKFFYNNKKGYAEIDVNLRTETLSKKLSEVGDNLIKMIRVFNSLYYNINGYIPNQIYVESVLCNCPNNLFESDDIYKVYLKIINYLRLKSLKDIPSINNTNKNINNDIVCGNCGFDFNKMLNLLN